MFGVGKEAQLLQEAGVMMEQVKTLLTRSVTVNLLLRAKKELQDKIKELDGIGDAKWRDKAGAFLAEHSEFLIGLDNAVDHKLQLEALNDLAAKTSAHLLAIETSLVDGQVAKAKVQFSVLAGRSQKLWTKENLTNFPAIQRLAIRFREVKRNIQALSDGSDVGTGSVQGDTSRTTSRTSASAGAFSSSASQLGDGRLAASGGGGSSSVLSASGPAQDSGPIENVFWAALQQAKRSFGKDTAMYCGAKRLSLTWAEVSVSSEAFAAYLVSLGVGTQDVVCIASLHSTHHCQLVAMGTLLAGARVGAINFRMDATMMAHQITTLAPRVLVVDDVLVPLAKVAAKLARPPVVVFAGVGEPPAGAVDISVALGFRSAVPSKDWRLPAGHSMQVGVFFTAGPTPGDLPVALAVKVKHVLTVTRDVHFSSEDVVYRGIPVYHFSFLALLLITATSGCASVCLRERISGPTLLKLLRVCKATTIVSPLAPLLDALKDVPKDDKEGTAPKLKYLFSGPAKPTPEASSALQAFFPSASVMEGFGLLPQGTLRRTYSNLSFGSLEGVSFIEDNRTQDAPPPPQQQQQQQQPAAGKKRLTADSTTAGSPSSAASASKGRAVSKTGSSTTLPQISTGKPPSSSPNPVQGRGNAAMHGDDELLPNAIPDLPPASTPTKQRAASAAAHVPDNLGRMATSLPVARTTSASTLRKIAADDSSLPAASATSPARLSPASSPAPKRRPSNEVEEAEAEEPSKPNNNNNNNSNNNIPAEETKAERKAREKREAAEQKQREKEAKEEAKRREKEAKEEAKRREKEERQRAKEGK
jgi:hypothetical protein